MKKIILSILVLVAVFNLSAQIVTRKTKPLEALIKVVNKSNVDVLTMPLINVNKLLQEDEQNKRLNLPYRFGYAFEVDYNMHNSGTWIKTEDGRVWTLKIVSRGAYSINLAYSRFYLPEGSRLYIYNEQKTVIQGPLRQRIIQTMADLLLT